MNNITSIGDNCCGCSLCSEICPTNAISMKKDRYGFLIPIVNNSICINCKKCINNCIIHKPIYSSSKPFNTYAAYIKNKKALINSSSGGMFFEIASSIIKKEGIVVGCSWDGRIAKHKCISTIKEIVHLQGSKYVQSEINGLFKELNNYVESGKQILFSGTPCQVAAFKSRFGERDNLYYVDIVCHGVPSPKLYSDYIDWFEKRHHGKISSYSFRSKKKNNWSLTIGADIKKKGKLNHIEIIGSIDPYYNAFLEGKTYRESCYCCPYARRERPGDITLADFWGINDVLPDMANINGVSAVLINNEKGKEIFELIKKHIEYKEVDYESIVRRNGNLSYPTKRPTIRSTIYEDEYKYGFDYAAKKYMKNKHYYVECVRNLFSNRTRQKFKKLILKFKNKSSTI